MDHELAQDAEVQAVQKKFMDQIDKACQGQVPDYKCDLPDWMDFKKTLTIFTEIMLSSTLHILESLNQAKEKGFQGNPMQSPEIQ